LLEVGAAPELLGERRPRKMDAVRHRRRIRPVEPASPPRFESLGHAGLQNFAGLETFANPGVERVEMTSDELAALCPITLQPDMYVATIAYRPKALCLESKSVKLYLMQFRNEGQFCEALTVRIRDDVATVLEIPADRVNVTLRQKSRGGIAIVASV
jgi:7-cyano-7-deazaguanine reductase